MNYLVLGGGGREHAIVRALKSSTLASHVYCYPGNAGISNDTDPLLLNTLNMSSKQLVTELIAAAKSVKIDVVVIGPEAELVAGYADAFRQEGFLVFGPEMKAAKLEGSKVYAKQFMIENGVPTARADVVKSVAETLQSAKKYQPPYILKADGLAAGKGVFICRDLAQLTEAATLLFDKNILGEAGRTALLEENLPGEEISVLCLTDGKSYELLPVCRDHKRLKDNDVGPNTGGMGVVGPVPMSDELMQLIRQQIFEKTLSGIQKQKFIYRGVIFVGIMLTAKGPQVLEYNVRFGDPETQVIMPLLDGEWAGVFKQIAEGSLPKLKWKKAAAACIVMAAEGYPDNPVKGVEINGLPDSMNGSESTLSSKEKYILHAGTKLINGKVVTAGGRVLNAVSCAQTVSQAVKQAYSSLSEIHWTGMQYRKDIGQSLL